MKQHRKLAPRPGHARRQDKIEVLGFEFDDLTLEGLTERIDKSIRERSRCWIATVNVNLMCLAAKSPAFADTIRAADIVTADGMPLVWASRFGERALRERVTGADLLKPLAVRAATESWRIFLCGGAPGVAEQAAESLRAFAPGLEIAGTASPTFPTEADVLDPHLNRALLAAIRQSRPDILLLALGSPKQETWIRHHLETHQIDVPVVVGVGAAFDFLVGRQTRAPRWMRAAGLEWLHRMASQPFRLGPRYALDGLLFARLIGRSVRRRLASRPLARAKSTWSPDKPN
jgi:exopolysaccharide biosynthesis WecB/TagA/CpsF family protein